MFSKAFSSSVLLLTLVVQANAHASVAPALGVSGTPVRADVQRPSTAKPCGNVDIASNLDTSTPVTADANGQFTVTASDFNPGADGSLQFSATVDPTSTGNSFKGTVDISKNGDPAPTAVSSQQLVASIAGQTCTGGTNGNLCLVSFKSTAGFGNCVVVQQGATTAGTAAAGNATAGDADTATAATSTATGDAGAATAATGDSTAAGNATNAATGATKATTAKKHKHGKKAKKAKAATAKAATAKASSVAVVARRNIGGTRLARAVSSANIQV